LVVAGRAGRELCEHGRVDLVVPVKALYRAKTRLRGAADGGGGDPDAHAALALALAHDTVAAVRRAGAVRRLLVISSDPVVTAELTALGVEVAPDVGGGLNAALRHGAALLRSRDADATVGALQADLPALRPEELDGAAAEAEAVFATGGTRAFCADAEGTGTTLLLAAAGAVLDPRFGAGSAQRHRTSGAVALGGAWPGLRRDVDTGDDLCAAAALGLGPLTRALLAPTGRC
jgi:2-phospho-L-lactate guanylyltransferase